MGNIVILHRLSTSPVVESIFRRGAAGDSSRKIALDLSTDGIIPALKYRVLYRNKFSEEGASRASDTRELHYSETRPEKTVYLSHTLLGKNKEVSVKSKKKVVAFPERWAVTEDTHPSLVDKALFQRTQENLGRGSRNYRAYDQVRKSIFGGVAVCARCGHALCSCGTYTRGNGRSIDISPVRRAGGKISGLGS